MKWIAGRLYFLLYVYYVLSKNSIYNPRNTLPPTRGKMGRGMKTYMERVGGCEKRSSAPIGPLGSLLRWCHRR